MAPVARVDLPFNYIEVSAPNPNVVPVLTPLDAFAIDSKIDDGFPLSGQTNATSSASPWTSYDWWQPRDPTQGAAGSATCVNNATSPATYNTTYSSASCNVRIKASF